MALYSTDDAARRLPEGMLYDQAVHECESGRHHFTVDDESVAQEQNGDGSGAIPSAISYDAKSEANADVAKYLCDCLRKLKQVGQASRFLHDHWRLCHCLHPLLTHVYGTDRVSRVT